MANQWLRLWHDMPTDSKWRTIARHAKQSISVVQAVWVQLLVSASQSDQRGSFSILPEDIASALDEEDGAVEAVIAAMQGRVLDGNRLTGWERRQPSKEDGASEASGVKGSSYGSYYIYYVYDRSNYAIKVAGSSNPWARVADMQKRSADKYELLCTMKTDARSGEILLEALSASRQKDGWFRCTQALNQLILNINNGVVNTVEEAVEFVASLPVEDHVATVAIVATTKDKDKDKDKEEKETREASRSSSKAKKEDRTNTLKTFLDGCKANGVKPIPDDHPIRQYMADSGISEEMAQIAWLRFREEHTVGARKSKRYTDWPATFANSVKDRWYRLWFVKAEGEAEWTSEGLQAKRAIEAAQAAKMQEEAA